MTTRLFRHAPAEKPLLLIYRDSPCVVIGRNQNPWKEINFQALRAQNEHVNVLHEKHAVPFIRRRSGGGTVYHVCPFSGLRICRSPIFVDAFPRYLSQRYVMVSALVSYTVFPVP